MPNYETKITVKVSKRGGFKNSLSGGLVELIWYEP